MGCPTEVEIGDNLVFTVCTHDPDTGVLTDADSVPSYRVYEDETGTAILTGSMAKLDDANTTGFYSESIACTSGNGFENGKTYTIYIEATVDSDKGGICYGFKAYDQRKADTIQISGDATAADNAELAFDGTGYGFTGCTIPTIEGKIDTVDAVADAIKAVTDNLQLEATTNYIKSVPQDLEDVSIGDGDTLGSGKAGEVLRWLRWFIKNTWDADTLPDPDELNIFKDDGTTKGFCFQIYTSSNHNYRKVVSCS